MRNSLILALAAVAACADPASTPPPIPEGALLIGPSPIRSVTPLPRATQEMGQAIHATMLPISQAIHRGQSLEEIGRLIDDRLHAHADAATRPVVAFTACRQFLELRLYPGGVTPDEQPYVAQCAERLAELGPQDPIVAAPMLESLRGYWSDARIASEAEASLATWRTASKNGAPEGPSPQALARVSETLSEAQRQMPARQAEAARRLDALVAAR